MFEREALPESGRAKRSSSVFIDRRGGAKRGRLLRFWDFEAKQKNRCFQIACLSYLLKLWLQWPSRFVAPEAMATQARIINGEWCENFWSEKRWRAGDRTCSRGTAAADVQIVLDANEAWTDWISELFNQLLSLISRWSSNLCRNNMMRHWHTSITPIPLCADESCHTTSQLSSFVRQVWWSAIGKTR